MIGAQEDHRQDIAHSDSGSADSRGSVADLASAGGFPDWAAQSGSGHDAGETRDGDSNHLTPPAARSAPLLSAAPSGRRRGARESPAPLSRDRAADAYGRGAGGEVFETAGPRGANAPGIVKPCEPPQQSWGFASSNRRAPHPRNRVQTPSRSPPGRSRGRPGRRRSWDCDAKTRTARRVRPSAVSPGRVTP